MSLELSTFLVPIHLGYFGDYWVARSWDKSKRRRDHQESKQRRDHQESKRRRVYQKSNRVEIDARHEIILFYRCHMHEIPHTHTYFMWGVPQPQVLLQILWFYFKPYWNSKETKWMTLINYSVRLIIQLSSVSILLPNYPTFTLHWQETYLINNSSVT